MHNLRLLCKSVWGSLASTDNETALLASTAINAVPASVLACLTYRLWSKPVMLNYAGEAGTAGDVQ